VTAVADMLFSQQFWVSFACVAAVAVLLPFTKGYIKRFLKAQRGGRK